jgi:hypothetical protein
MVNGQPFPNREEHARLTAAVNQLDDLAGRPELVPPPPQVPEPSYGGPRRDAVNSLVDDVVQDVCAKISALEKQLEALRSQVLVGGAAAKEALTEQIAVCGRVNDEVERIGDVVDSLAQRVLRLS